ncbi:MAG: hypothetical protein Q4C60_11080 [Eubacteriales bacterium]|nr:hypothetical protein [Eubacteriales bacterium]
MRKCCICGGKLLNDRCVECGMIMPPEGRYTMPEERDKERYRRGAGSEAHAGRLPTVKEAAASGSEKRGSTAPLRPASGARKAQNRKLSLLPVLFVLAVAVLSSGFLKSGLKSLIHTAIDLSSSSTVTPEHSISAEYEPESSYDFLYGYSGSSLPEIDGSPHPDEFAGLIPGESPVPADGEHWSATLSGGVYYIGNQIPAGIYTIEPQDAASPDYYLDYTQMDPAHQLYDYALFADITDTGNTNTVTRMDEVLLCDGACVVFSGSGALTFTTDNAQTADLRPAQQNTLSQSVTLTLEPSRKKTYTVGRDIPAGTYDLILRSGCAFLDYEAADTGTQPFYSLYLANNNYAISRFSNLLLQDGDVLSLEALEDYETGESLSLELLPSGTVYDLPAQWRRD